MMGAEDHVDWFDDAVRRAAVRRIVPREYVAELHPYSGWVSGVALVVTTLGIMIVAFTQRWFGLSSLLVALIPGFIVATVVKYLLDAIQEQYKVKLTFEGVLLMSPLKQKLLRWEDVGSACMNEEVGGGLSFATYSLSIFSFKGEEFKVGPRFEVQLIAADIQKVLEVIRETEQSRRSDMDLTIGI
jgi:uncharacterized membrane protein